jgi:hypothetical protein
MDEELTFTVPVPRDRNGRVLLSDAQWSARLDEATEQATQDRGGYETWTGTRVVGSDEHGNAVVSMRRRRPGEQSLPAGPVGPRSSADRSETERAPKEQQPTGQQRDQRAAAARAEAARRQEQRQKGREQQRGGQGRDR